MGIIDRIFGGKNKDYFIPFWSEIFGMKNNITKFSEGNAYSLALSLSEIFNPIDAIASRVSSITYEIQDKNGKKVNPNKDEQRLMNNPNPLSSFSDLIYSMVFSELADGNSYTYRVDTGSKASQSLISSVWCLPPNSVSIKYKSRTPDFYLIKDKSDLIEYYEDRISDTKIAPQSIIHRTSSFYKSNKAGLIEGRSPLIAVEKNINNLLAVYSARFKVYEENGMAGILTSAKTGTGDIGEVASDKGREAILEDIKNRNGLTGDKRFLTISSIPVNFIKTLATISELQPFEETEADAIAIAGIFQVDKELIPKRGSTTFTNKKSAEIMLWQNVIKDFCWDICRALNSLFLLDEDKHFVPIFDNVEVLQADAKVKLESDSQMIENIIRIEESSIKNNDTLIKILNSYKDAR